jgi:hypothetical protein
MRKTRNNMGILDHMKISRWMYRHVSEHVDPITGEVNCTQLAEAACEEFQGYEHDTIPEHYFEMAFAEAKEYEEYGHK